MKLLSTLLSITISSCLFGQTVIMDNDTAVVNNQKLFFIKTIKKGLLGNGAELSIRTMDGKELIFYTDGEFAFMDDGAKALYNGKEKIKFVAQAVVDNELINDNGLNADAKKRFLIKYKIPEPVFAADGKMVERDRTAMIFVTNGKIKQGGVQIGLVKETTQLTANNRVEWVTEIKFLDGSMCAKTFSPELNSTSVRIVTAKDNKTHIYSAKNSLFVQDEVIKFLVDRLYL